jgi:N-formylmaleamate deformylase
MMKYTEADLTIKGVKIHYYRTGGKKPPFILLHGMSDSGLCWTPIAEVLSEKYDVIMPDLQGHGLSNRIDAAFTFESHMNQVVGLVKALRLKKPLIMGHSLGAGTAVNVAANHPGLPRAIILEDPAWSTPSSLSRSQAEANKMTQDFKQIFSGIQQKTAAELLTECRNTNPNWSETESKPWAESKLQFDIAYFNLLGMNPSSYTELMPKIKCPVLLVLAENGINPRETAEDIAQLWKSKHPFKWVQIKGATHNIRRDKFQEFQDALFGFLKEIRA